MSLSRRPPVRGLALARRFAGGLRRASDGLRRALTIALLALVYVIVLPWFALVRRLRRPAAPGWRVRRDPNVGSLERLREPF